ncbi:fluorothreonine transaldolase [Nocardia brasiliensis]|uniref:fluorothreonine transaldolase n=1 Tax=Nocardia brasiliensis TaxID=37326 RepID=UPI0018934EEF|nr:fluorothreonine transaldolase [Nocardia brasiliensis]MBF6541717.1 fluorothreonine transaldolase [Nocardia brasiliensis]
MTELSNDTPLSLTAIRDLVTREEVDNEQVLHLTANETVLSPFAQNVLSTKLANRYLLEHLDMRLDSPSRLNNFLYRGLNRVNAIEQSATQVCRELFGAEYTEFRCLSGLHAMQTTFAALSQPGDKIMRISTKDGGHFLTELMCRSFGRRSTTYAFGDLCTIDLERTREIFERERPSLLYIDAMNYLFPFPLRELKQICGDVPLIFDASHTLGLIAGGQFQDPLAEGADILQANTHKTFFGPQKGLILGKSRSLMERITYTLSNGMVSSQHTASTLALFIALHEMYEDGHEYAARVIENARHLAGLLHERGIPVLAADRGFTQNHMFFIDTRSLGAGPMLAKKLLDANISVNRSIAFEHIDTLRLGVQEITRRGYSGADLERIAGWIEHLLLRDANPESVARDVATFVVGRQNIRYCGKSAGPRRAPRGKPSPTAPARPRWVNISLTKADTRCTTETVEAVRALGEAAAVFEHQTDSAGNISVRTNGHTFVSASGSYLKDLAPHDFVELVDFSDWTLRCEGAGPPSAESYMHYLVRTSVDARYIVHNHYIPGEEIADLDVLVIPPKEYGSVQLAEAVAKAAPRSHIIYIRRHGLVFWSDTLEECTALMAKVASRRI